MSDVVKLIESFKIVDKLEGIIEIIDLRLEYTDSVLCISSTDVRHKLRQGVSKRTIFWAC